MHELSSNFIYEALIKLVMPAQAGIQVPEWIPAYAGMTKSFQVL
jgi:hypothetical protein